MPTYDYKCTNCGYTFELFQTMSAEPVKVCPQCKGLVKRLIGAGAGPIFKGTGFYQTDYKNTSGNNKSSPVKTKTETKPKENKPAGKSTEK
ncbi:MAG: FmdB family zinc ribbon protein [Ignavibacteriaceae bacterium]